jgi:uncharacterized protein YcbK (DUF882 family)
MNNPITLDMYFTDFVTKQDRRKQYPDEFTKDIEANAQALKVNAFLTEIGITSAQVTSGWRPASVNNKVTNAAKKSYHMLGMAVDILDNKNQDLAKLVANSAVLLRKYGLFMEDMNATKGQNTNWCHIDMGTRSDRPSRIFLP